MSFGRIVAIRGQFKSLFYMDRILNRGIHLVSPERDYYEMIVVEEFLKTRKTYFRNLQRTSIIKCLFSGVYFRI